MKIVKPYNRIAQKPTELKKYVENRKPLHEILKPLLTLAQFFGLLPVMGVRGDSPIDLKFSFFTLRFLQSIVCLFSMMVLGSTNLLQLLEKGVNFYRSGGVLFYTFAILTMFLFMKLAYYWPKLMQEWAFVEYQMSVYAPSFNLRRKIYIVAIVILGMATFEHGLSIYSTLMSIKSCVSKGSSLQAYFEIRFVQMFNRTPFTYWKAVFCQIINIVATFVWTFIDVFLITMSLAIVELFQRITFKIQSLHLQETHENIWLNLREDFNRVTVLCRLTNSGISEMVLLSFTSNLCSICAQILHSLQPMKHVTDGLYFMYSMSFLLGRTLFLTLTISKVYESSRAPLSLLFQVPRSSYCREIGRFIQQISSEVIAITGMNFFAVRKEMILSVAGTILTYELVLIQFNAQVDDDDSLLPKNISHKIVLPPCSKYDDADEIYRSQLSNQ